MNFFYLVSFYLGIPNVPADTLSDQDGSPISITAQCHVSRSCSQSQIPVTKSETFSLLGNHQSGVSCTSSITKSDKRSLASKLSGSLNRSNSGKIKTILSLHCKNGKIAESRSYSEPKISAMYEKYKDDEEDCVLSDGIEEFCIDLQLKPDEFKVLGKNFTV